MLHGSRTDKDHGSRPVETIETLELPVADPHLTDFYRNVAAATRGEAELIVKPGEALRVMKVIDLAFESGEKEKEYLLHDLKCFRIQMKDMLKGINSKF